MNEAINNINDVFTIAHGTAVDVNGIDQCHNGTGYFEAAVDYDFGLENGQVGRATDRHRRRVVVIGTAVGNVIVFERFSEGEVFACNQPFHIKALLGITGALSYDDMTQFLGYPGDYNIGETIDQLVKGVDLRRRIADRKKTEPA